MKNKKKKMVVKKAKNLMSNPLFDMFAVQPSFFINGKETHSTCCGCVMTICFGIVMVAIFVFYFLQFIARANYSVSMTTLSEETYPNINLYKNGYFLAVAYKEGDKLMAYGEVEQTAARVLAFQVDIDFTSDPPVTERTKLDLIECDDIKLSKDALKGEQSVFNKDSKCLEFSDDTLLTGSATSSTNFSYIEVRVETCDETSDKCTTKNLQDKSASGYQASFDAAYAKMKEISLLFSFLEVSADTTSFDSPLVKNINSNHYLKTSLMDEKYQDYYFGTYEVNTLSGLFTTENSTVSSMFLDTAFTESTYRDPTYKEDFKTKTATDQQKMPYGVIRIMASNKKVSVERKYETLVDVLGTVGGIAETVTFVFVLIMFLHQDIRLEQRLLNEGLLQVEEEEIQSGNGFGTTKTYGYWEILCYKYFSICKGKNKRFRDYERDTETMQERLDIRKVISNAGNLNVMANTFLEDYQMKLIPYLNKDSEEKDFNKRIIGNKEALMKAKETQGKNPQQLEMDQYIVKHLDEGFKEHYDDEALSGLVDRKTEFNPNPTETNKINPVGEDRVNVI